MANFFRYTTAIVRGVASTLPAQAQRLQPSVSAVSSDKVTKQTKNYANVLRKQVGLRVIELPADDKQPDCVFVEDTVVAIGKKALITTPGHVTRRSESGPVVKCLQNLGVDLTFMKDKNPDARMDGGDVVFTGEEIFVGISSRTNDAGCDVLADAFPAFPVTPVPVYGALHLDSACSFAGYGILLQSIGSPELIEMAKILKSRAKKKYSFVEVGGRPTGANCLYIDSPTLGKITVHQPYEAFPESEKAYESLRGVKKIKCDISELDKVDGALTCCSVLLAI